MATGCGRTASTAHALNELVRTVDRLAELVTEPLDLELQAQVDRARQFKVLEAITDIDLADPLLMAEAGLPTESERVRRLPRLLHRCDPRRHDAGLQARAA